MGTKDLCYDVELEFSRAEVEAYVWADLIYSSTEILLVQVGFSSTLNCGSKLDEKGAKPYA